MIMNSGRKISVLAAALLAMEQPEEGDEAAQKLQRQQRLDFSELGEAGEYGSAVADLHAALRAYQDGDHRLACVKALKVASCLAGFEAGADFLAAVENGSELRDLFRDEQYLAVLSRLVRMIPPTGEPEIDIPLGVLQSLELVRLRQSWDSARDGNFRLAARQLGEAILPKSLGEAVRNTRPETVAPVAAGLAAGYLGYTGRFGRGARTNFFLASFACTAGIHLVKRHKVRLLAAEANGRPVLYTGWDEHLLLT